MTTMIWQHGSARSPLPSGDAEEARPVTGFGARRAIFHRYFRRCAPIECAACRRRGQRHQIRCGSVFLHEIRFQTRRFLLPIGAQRFTRFRAFSNKSLLLPALQGACGMHHHRTRSAHVSGEAWVLQDPTLCPGQKAVGFTFYTLVAQRHRHTFCPPAKSDNLPPLKLCASACLAGMMILLVIHAWVDSSGRCCGYPSLSTWFRVCSSGSLRRKFALREIEYNSTNIIAFLRALRCQRELRQKRPGLPI